MLPEYPIVACPKCGKEQTDMDGFGFIACLPDGCGYCKHVSAEREPGGVWKCREGWAVLVTFRSTPKPHYWKRRDLTHVYDSLCGLEIDQGEFHPGARVALEPGVFMIDRCKRCSKKHAAQV